MINIKIKKRIYWGIFWMSIILVLMGLWNDGIFAGWLIIVGAVIFVLDIILWFKFIEKEDDDKKIIYCEKCKLDTEHLKCGFGEPGGLWGNGRYRCLERGCGYEHI